MKNWKLLLILFKASKLIFTLGLVIFINTKLFFGSIDKVVSSSILNILNIFPPFLLYKNPILPMFTKIIPSSFLIPIFPK